MVETVLEDAQDDVVAVSHLCLEMVVELPVDEEENVGVMVLQGGVCGFPVGVDNRAAGWMIGAEEAVDEAQDSIV